MRVTLSSIGIVVGLVEAEEVCIVPHNSICRNCDRTGDSRQGEECVVNGEWYPCNSVIEKCCTDPRMILRVDEATCIAEYKNATTTTTTHYNGDPDVGDDVYCDRVIAHVGLNTEWCQDKCREIIGEKSAPLLSAKFSPKCQYDHYTIEPDDHVHFVTDIGDGREVSDHEVGTHTCYDHWVYGYSEPANLAGYQIFYNVSTPALCQAKCQADSNCERFTWTASAQGTSEGQDDDYRCALKSETQVETALAIQYNSVDNPPNYDADYCNYGMAHECWTKHYECLPCDGAMACVWRSEYHVNGFRTCDIEPTCTANSTPKPTAKPSPTAGPSRTAKPTGPSDGSEPTAKPSPTAGPFRTAKPVTGPSDGSEPASSPKARPSPQPEPNDETSEPCVPPTPEPECSTRGACGCRNCGCDNDGQIYLRVADKPSFLQLQVRNDANASAPTGEPMTTDEIITSEESSN